VAERGEWSGLFAAAFRQSRNAMALLDGERCFVDVNGAYLTLLGYRRRELIGQPVFRFVVGGPLASRAEWRSMLNSGQFNG